MPDFFIDHESGDINDYYSSTIIVGTATIAVTAAAALNGTNFGLEGSVFANNDAAMGQKIFSFPAGITQYTISFYFDLNSITIPLTATGFAADIEPCLFLDSLNNQLGWLLIGNKTGVGYVIRLYWYDDNRVLFFNAVGVAIPDGQIFIEIIVTAASSAVANDGSVVLKVNDAAIVTHGAFDLYNDFNDINKFQFGCRGAEPGITGSWYIDQITATSSPLSVSAGKLRVPSTVLADGSSDSNIASIDADGSNIYLALLNISGFPTLIQINTGLIADGSIVFEPGDGDRIGVKCGLLDSSVVWISGNFGGINKVEKSDDAGATFDIKNDSSTGDIRAFEVGPNNDETVIIFDETNGDIIETIDDGATWTTINAAVTPLINSLSRLDTNPEEIIAGNQGAANNSIDYSPNAGVDLEDYQTGVYPNADATKVVIAN